MKNPGVGGGGANQSVFCVGGMDIFWNHTILLFGGGGQNTKLP